MVLVMRGAVCRLHPRATVVHVVERMCLETSDIGRSGSAALTSAEYSTQVTCSDGAFFAISW